jgi:hypothetical protein
MARLTFAGLNVETSSGKSGKALSLSHRSSQSLAGAGSIVLAQNAGLTVANLEIAAPCR